MDYPRSHTDPLANLVVLSSLDIKSHLAEILDRDMPIRTLPAFLHEMTHHWCFDTPVGYALHLLFLKARRAALGIQQQQKTGRTDASWQLLDNVVRYEVALQVLRPLSEGLALFAEHDAIPGAAEVISTPMLMAAGLYGRGVGVLGPEPWKEMPLLLAGGRLSLQHVRRKADLLIQPLECAAGGYLPGYLLTKLLWHSACQQAEIFLDTDFFLQFLRAHLFDDWTLVGLLLDGSKADISALDPIRQHIGLRLREFVASPGLEQRAKEFERLSLAGESEVLPMRTAVLNSEIKYLPIEHGPGIELGRQRFRQTVESLFDQWPKDQDSRNLMRHDAREISLRGLITLGHATLTGKAQPEGLGLYDNDRYLATLSKKALGQKPIDDGELDLDVIALSGVEGLFIAISRKDTLLTCIPVGNYGVPSYFEEVMMDRQARLDAADTWRKLINQTLQEADLDDHVEIVRNSTNKALDQFLLPLALTRVSDADLDATLQEMKDDGMLPLFGGDIGLVIDAAAASLCLPTPYQFSVLDGFHEWSQGDPRSSMLEINKRLKSRLKIEPFILSEELGRFLPVALI